jgi:hypothetical protein
MKSVSWAARVCVALLIAVPLAWQEPDVVAADSARGIRVCSGGDFLLGNNLDTAWARTAASRLRVQWGQSDHPDSLLIPLMPLVSDADVLLLNIEGAIGEGPAPAKCRPGSTACYAFRSPPSAAPAIRRLVPNGVVIGNLANNHARDAGDVRVTAWHLTRADVFVTGVDTIATPVVTAAGDTIAFLGFHTSPAAPDARNLAAVRRHTARAVARWGIVVVNAHIGGEGINAQRTVNATEMFLGSDRGNPVAFADAAFDGGATLVIGHGPHVLRAGEWRDDRLVLYSLGNLLTYGPFNNNEPANRGVVACAVITQRGVVSEADLRATVQLAPGIVRPDPTGRALRLIDSLSALDFPHTGVRVAPDGRVLRRGEN